MKLKSKFLFLEQPKYTYHLVQYKRIFCRYAQGFTVNYLPKQTDLLNTCICFEYLQCLGKELKQFRFVCHTDYKYFQADEKQMLTKTTKLSILPIYSCYCCAICSWFQNSFFNKIQNQT